MGASPTTVEQTTGHCLCGRIGFTFEPDAIRWSGHCYCESCRRATASAVTTFVGLSESGFRWTKGKVRTYESSPHVVRSFCPDCGTQLAFQSEKWPGEVHVYAATLCDSTWLQPEAIYHADERLPWIDVKGDFPKR